MPIIKLFLSDSSSSIEPARQVATTSPMTALMRVAPTVMSLKRGLSRRSKERLKAAVMRTALMKSQILREMSSKWTSVKKKIKGQRKRRRPV